MNVDAIQPEYAINVDDQDPLYKHVTGLSIVGTSTSSIERVVSHCELKIRGDEAPSRGVHTRLKDVQERGEYGELKYRVYRGRHIPIYQQPLGFGLLDKVRGEPAWSGWATLAARLVTDMLILLGSGRPLFLSIDERKMERTRWIYGVSLQTTDPAEE